MNSKLFGIKISALRKEKGLTQSQLAEQLNVSNKTISRWETGEGYPEITLLVPLANALGVTVDQLLSDEEPENKSNPYQGAEESSFAASSAYNSGTYNKGKKEYKHRDIPVEWPGLPLISLNLNKFSVISNILHMLFYMVFTFILIDRFEYYKYTDKPWNSGIGNQYNGNSGSGNFMDSSSAYTWFAAMAVILIILIVFNIVCKLKGRLTTVQICRNIVITILLAVAFPFGFSCYTGKNGFYSSVGLVLEKIYELKESSFFYCDFFRMEPKFIAICGIAACVLYVLTEIIRVIICHRQGKNIHDADDYVRLERKSYRAFWRSLTIFNKIALICVLVNIFCTIIGLLIAGFAGMAVAVIVISNIAKAGLLISAVGLVLGLLDVYDRQNKASIILIVINAVIMYVFPLLTVVMTMVMGFAVTGTTNLIADVSEVVSIL